jgi:hypothetical protein
VIEIPAEAAVTQGSEGVRDDSSAMHVVSVEQAVVRLVPVLRAAVVASGTIERTFSTLLCW